MKKAIWLIGPGNIGLDYAKVLIAQKVDFEVIGRSEVKNWPVPVYTSGLTNFLNSKDYVAEYAIVAVDESQLCRVTLELIDFGVKNVLIEKPAGVNKREVEILLSHSKKNNCKLFVAYNRRFYQSVKECKKIISNNKEPISVNFTFTEWTHLIDFDSYTKEELEHFILCNSSHVPDIVFYLFGEPQKMSCITAASGSLSWHPSSKIFAGCGVTTEDIPFSYNAHWGSAGRWGVEIYLSDRKLILKPLEKLQVQFNNSLCVQPHILENEEIDIKFKPGLFEEVKSFLTTQDDLCTIEEQSRNFKWYYKMGNYKY